MVKQVDAIRARTRRQVQQTSLRQQEQVGCAKIEPLFYTRFGDFQPANLLISAQLVKVLSWYGQHLLIGATPFLHRNGPRRSGPTDDSER